MAEKARYSELTQYRSRQAELQAALDKIYEGITVKGRTLREIFAQASVPEKIADISNNSNGCYMVHAPAPEESDTIYFNKRTLESAESFLSVEIHERTHALQSRAAAALHMEPVMPDNDIILCPNDYVRLRDMMERDAFGKQGFFLAAIAAIMPEKNAALRALSMTVKEFRYGMQEMRGDIHQAMAMASAARLKFPAGWGDTQDYYNKRTLNIFGRNMMERRHEPITYVRLEPEDMIAVGSTYGINSLGPDGDLFPEFRKGPHLSLANKARAAFWDYRLGVGPRRDLPTVSEALAARGMDRQSFLAKALASPSRPS